MRWHTPMFNPSIWEAEPGDSISGQPGYDPVYSAFKSKVGNDHGSSILMISELRSMFVLKRFQIRNLKLKIDLLFYCFLSKY